MDGKLMNILLTERRKHLLEKLRKREEWSMESLLAYCQGRAFDMASDAAQAAGKLHSGTHSEKRKKALSAGLSAMIEELKECLSIVTENSS